jgi:hypothetical protein
MNGKPERLGKYDIVAVEGYDRHGIPTGKHTLSCGCKMEGRTMLEACKQHRHLFSITDVSLSE